MIFHPHARLFSSLVFITIHRNAQRSSSSSDVFAHEFLSIFPCTLIFQSNRPAFMPAFMLCCPQISNCSTTVLSLGSVRLSVCLSAQPCHLSSMTLSADSRRRIRRAQVPSASTYGSHPLPTNANLRPSRCRRYPIAYVQSDFLLRATLTVYAYENMAEPVD